jgi:HSP20 family molecular chaperone IbpA
VNTGLINATFHDGVLELMIPKPERKEGEKKRITIK